jgi:hypothetical protein
VFLLKARDAGRGIERIKGGPGKDVAYFAFPRRSHIVRHQKRGTLVRSGRHRFLLRGVERLRFKPAAPRLRKGDVPKPGTPGSPF